MGLPPKTKKAHAFPTGPLSKGVLHEALAYGRAPPAQDMNSLPPNELTAKMQIEASQAANNFRLPPKLSRQPGRPAGSAAWTAVQTPDSVLT